MSDELGAELVKKKELASQGEIRNGDFIDGSDFITECPISIKGYATGVFILQPDAQNPGDFTAYSLDPEAGTEAPKLASSSFYRTIRFDCPYMTETEESYIFCSKLQRNCCLTAEKAILKGAKVLNVVYPVDKDSLIN